MNILIVGACGFVGSAVALRLRERVPGVRITGVDSLMRPGSETNRSRLQASGIQIVHGDIRCASDVEALPHCDWIVDAAGIPSVAAGVDGRVSSRQLVEHNLDGTINLLEHARRHGAGLVLLSTSRVYSIQALCALPIVVARDAFVPDAARTLPAGCTVRGISEYMSTAAPVSLYGATKLASEALALEYGYAFGLPVIVDRCGILTGGGQFGTGDQGIISYWIRAYASRRPLRYTGFGGCGYQVRDLLHVDDLADLLARQMRNPDRAAGRVWNVGGGLDNALSLAQLSAWCADRFGPTEVTADGGPRPFDVPWIVMDHGEVADAFGWSPRTGLAAVLADIADHHQRHPDWLDLSRTA